MSDNLNGKFLSPIPSRLRSDLSLKSPQRIVSPFHPLKSQPIKIPDFPSISTEKEITLASPKQSTQVDQDFPTGQSPEKHWQTLKNAVIKPAPNRQLSVIRTWRRGHKRAPLIPIYCGVEIELGLSDVGLNKPDARYCVYIHDGFYGIDYFTKNFYLNNQAPITTTTTDSKPPLHPPSQDLQLTESDTLLSHVEDEVIKFLREYAANNHYKIQCAGVGVKYESCKEVIVFSDSTSVADILATNKPIVRNSSADNVEIEDPAVSDTLSQLSETSSVCRVDVLQDHVAETTKICSVTPEPDVLYPNKEIHCVRSEAVAKSGVGREVFLISKETPPQPHQPSNPHTRQNSGIPFLSIPHHKSKPHKPHQQQSTKCFRLPARLWFELDIIPLVLSTHGQSIDERACSAARKSIQYLTPHSVGNITRVSVGYRHQVEVDADGQIHLADLEDYRIGTSRGTWDTLMQLARLTRDKKLKIMFFSSTPQGGGVALMRHALIRLFHLLDVDASWYVVKPNPAVFHVTKRKFHNVLQGVAPKSVHLEDQDKSLWETWTEENVERYWKEGPFQVCDVAIIDDPQPSGIIPYLKQVNPDCKIIYRNHIEIRSDLVSDPTSEVHHVWNYLWEKGIKHADLFISHPVENFTPANVPDEKVVLMPAVSDPLDGLNKELSPIDIEYYWTLFNRQAFDQIGRRVDFWNRPYFIQISRFDPSKGIGEVIKAYARFRRAVHSEMVLAQVPQLVICGHGSIDDPDGTVIFEEVLAMLQGEVHLGISGEEKFVRPTCSESELGHIQDEEDISLESIAADIIVVRLPPSDQILNALLRGAKVALQLSIREGFEIKVTEALAKGVPVIAYNSGGIPHQIHHGRTGFLVNSSLSCHTRTSQVARYMRQLILDTSLYDRMSRTAQESVDEEYFTVFNAVNWLFAANAVVDGSLPVNSDRAEEVKCIVKDAQVKLFEELGVPERVVGVLMGGEMGKGSKFDVTEGGGMEWGNEPHGKCRYLTERDVIEYQARNRALSGEKYLLVKDLWQTEYLGIVGSE